MDKGRRSFLKMSATGVTTAMTAATGMLAWQPRAHAATINKTYYITDGNFLVADDSTVYCRGFSNSSNSLAVPAEPMIVQEGDTVNVTIINTLNTNHSFVIDGVVDSGTIYGNTTKVVSFTANAVGSHLFYCNKNAPYNRMLGLHGGFAVMPSGSSNELYDGSPTFVQQYFWVFNEFDPAWNSRLAQGLTPNTTYTPAYFTINGLSSRPPGANGHADPYKDAMANYSTAIHGHVGDRTLIRVLNAGKCSHAVHTHANHMEWLSSNGVNKTDIWKKDIIRLDYDMGKIDVIFPFEPPPDAYPPVSTGMFPMHLHDEMSQTADGGYYMFGAMTELIFD